VSLTVIHDPEVFRTRLADARGGGHRVGLVPTMGALHDGHLSLVEVARDRGASHVAMTIFVNPLQFDDGGDLDAYPRTLEADLEKCRSVGVDTVFAPAPTAMYPEGFQTHVEVEALTLPLEGAYRPGHFRGVTTVVAKLFALAGPCVAPFGRKDYQQWKVLERMAGDLFLPVEVVGAPIVREADGLAMSSRNARMSSAERGRALALSAGLGAAWDRFAAGERDAAALLEAARAPIEAAMDRVDYVALADPDHLGPIAGRAGDRALVAVAAHLGATRLIDNVVLGEDPRPGPR
jgi:pantoate--beta-alanine ligase